MPLFNLVKQQAAPIMSQILTCPFVELIHLDLLPQTVFDFYSEQDELFNVDLFLTYRIIAKKLAARPETLADSYLVHEGANLLEQLVNDGFFNPKRTPGLFQPLNIFTAKIDIIEKYTQHLKTARSSPSITIALAAVIPCFDSYRKIGEKARSQSIKPLPRYKTWIEANYDEAWVTFGQQLIEIAEKTAALELADGTLENLDQAVKTSIQSYLFERDFFNDAFQGRPQLESSHPTMGVL